MSERNINLPHQLSFDSLRQQSEDGSEYWWARELAPLLEYVQWRNFMQVVEKAKTACQRAGHHVTDHFAEVSKMVGIGSGAQRPVDDVRLSRYACYLIVQNADPSKPVIAAGQTYFAVQYRAGRQLVQSHANGRKAAPRPGRQQTASQQNPF